jgi:hypothetical protein
MSNGKMTEELQCGKYFVTGGHVPLAVLSQHLPPRNEEVFETPQ